MEDEQMSLDVHLALEGEEVFDSNITHNLGRMADAVGIYEACWRPEEIGVATAAQLAPLLLAGITKMVADPDHYETFDAENGWGTYKQFLPWLTEYHRACKRYPGAIISVSR